MKSIVESIQQIDEAREVSYRVSLLDVNGSDGMPIGATIVVSKNDQKAFEKWLEDQQDNTIGHAEGGNIEY